MAAKAKPLPSPSNAGSFAERSTVVGTVEQGQPNREPIS